MLAFRLLGVGAELAEVDPGSCMLAEEFIFLKRNAERLLNPQ